MKRPEILDFNSVTNVLYGDANIIPIYENIQTKSLYSCLGVVLINKEKVALAHIPAIEPFAIINYSNPKYISSDTRTFKQLTEKLLNIFGNKTSETQAYLVGGIENVSDNSKNKTIETLLEWGLENKNIKHIGPHNKNEEWDLIINQGNFSIQSKKHITATESSS